MIVVQVLLCDFPQVALVEDEDMVQTLSAQAAKKTLANSIRIWRMVGRADFFDTCSHCHCREMLSELGVIVPNQILGTFTPRRGLSQLLRHPAANDS